MRTTLDIDDDVLRASKDIAKRENKTAGMVISELVRRALTTPVGTGAAPGGQESSFLGFEPFGRRGGIVTNELVDELREEGEY